MRNVSAKYLQAMENRRDFYPEAEVTFLDGVKKTLTKDDFCISGNSIIDSAECSSFPLGILVSKRITLTIINDEEQWKDYSFTWAKIFLKTKFDLDDGTTETLNIGTFTVVTPESYGSTIQITAMDDCYKTDVDYSTNLEYPLSAGAALKDSCDTCGITLQTLSFPNDNFIIESQPENLTHRQFIGLIAMIAGGNAKMDEYNRLMIMPYDFRAFEQAGLDGGIFDDGEPLYETGDTASGGSFNPWDTGYEANGGSFGDRNNLHLMYDYMSGIKIEADDVVITGIQMVDENKEVYLYGKEGYILQVENVLATGKEAEVVALIGEKIVGIRFRPFSGDHIAYPLAEFMDMAYIFDYKSNMYQTVLTDVSFTYNGYTTMQCTAESPVRNSSKYYGNEVKAIIEARKMVKDERTERERALETLANELAHSSGLYITPDVQLDGSTIYYMHDKPTLGESMIVWKLTAEAIGISTDGGKTYPVGVDATGMAILSRIYTIGLNADYITTGAFEIRRDGKVMVRMDKDTGEVILRPDTFELSSGQTIDSIAQDAVNDFVSKTYDPKITELQKQLDGQIESFYYDYAPDLTNEPASNWKTDTDKQKHEGDLFYDKTTGYAYRFQKEESAWEWRLIQDTDITKAIQDAANAQDTADGKRRTFLTTPTPPYDKGDLWYGGTESEVKVCTTTRESGVYNASDWSKQDKYIDQAAADSAASKAVNAQTQQDIFNKLTDGGKKQGIYLKDGLLYINAEYMATGVLQSHDGETFYLDLDNGVLKMKATELTIEGQTVADIAQSEATSAANGALDSAKKYADGAAKDAVAGQTQEDIFNKLTNDGKMQGIYMSGNQLYINGSYIKANSIGATQIDVSNLFAQNITATGTISGVTLSGATGNFTGTVYATDLTAENVYKIYNGDARRTIKCLSSERNATTNYYYTIRVGVHTGDIGSNGCYMAFKSDGTEALIEAVGTLTVRGPIETTGVIQGGLVRGGTLYEWAPDAYGNYSYRSLTDIYLKKGASVSYATSAGTATSASSATTANRAHYLYDSLYNTGDIVAATHTSDQTHKVFRCTTITSSNNPDTYLGASTARWAQIYSAAAVNTSSDRRMKEDFQNFSEAYENAYMDLNPVLYRFKNVNGGKHDRVHSGFIAQEVETALEKYGLSSMDCAFLCKDLAGDYDENGEFVNPYKSYGISDGDYVYSFKYEEMIAWNTHMIQKALKRQKEQDETIARLTAQLEALTH